MKRSVVSPFDLVLPGKLMQKLTANDPPPRPADPLRIPVEDPPDPPSQDPIDPTKETPNPPFRDPEPHPKNDPPDHKTAD
jgi:hypothetical protein